MTTASFVQLDQAELLRLALHAIGSNDSGTALSYLKEAVSRPDATANAHFMLGAEYAQIGMIDRAIPAIETALALDPALSIARFQLGLLRLTCGDPATAIDVLHPLDSLGDEHPLFHFGKGLVALARNELSEALHGLTCGIERNHDNPALNTDMLKIAHNISRAISDQATSSESADTQHIFLSAYKGSMND